MGEILELYAASIRSSFCKCIHDWPEYIALFLLKTLYNLLSLSQHILCEH